MKQLFLLLQSISWMVESTGIEPVTSCLQGRRSPSWANPPSEVWSGGPRTRFSAEKPRRLQQSTGLLPRAAFRVHFGLLAFRTQSPWSWLLFATLLEVVGQNGLEPSTSRLSVVCSSQLSYWPIFSFHIFFRYILPVPSKLNNASSLKLYNPCTDLRTLLEDTL